MSRLLIASATLLLVSCGSSTEDSQISSTPTPTPAQTVAEIATIADVPSVVNCHGFDDRTQEEELPEYVLEFGTCFMATSYEPAELYSFASKADMAAFWGANEESGPTPEDSVTVGLIVIHPTVPSDLAQLQEDVGQS
jgi:hypothetical protein